MHSRACAVARPYAACSNEGEGLRRWENQRMLSSLWTVSIYVTVNDTFSFHLISLLFWNYTDVRSCYRAWLLQRWHATRLIVNLRPCDMHVTSPGLHELHWLPVPERQKLRHGVPNKRPTAFFSKTLPVCNDNK